MILGFVVRKLTASIRNNSLVINTLQKIHKPLDNRFKKILGNEWGAQNYIQNLLIPKKSVKNSVTLIEDINNFSFKPASLQNYVKRKCFEWVKKESKNFVIFAQYTLGVAPALLKVTILCGVVKGIFQGAQLCETSEEDLDAQNTHNYKIDESFRSTKEYCLNIICEIYNMLKRAREINDMKAKYSPKYCTIDGASKGILKLISGIATPIQVREGEEMTPSQEAIHEVKVTLMTIADVTYIIAMICYRISLQLSKHCAFVVLYPFTQVHYIEQEWPGTYVEEIKQLCIAQADKSPNTQIDKVQKMQQQNPENQVDHSNKPSSTLNDHISCLSVVDDVKVAPYDYFDKSFLQAK